jgi:glycosyltransferase involved in cell wall biosynthesis
MMPSINAIDMIPVRNQGHAPKQCGGVYLPPNGDWQLVPISFMHSFGWDKTLAFDFSTFCDRMATRDEQNRFTFDWWCPLSMVDGYGRHALAIFRGLKMLGCNPILKDVDWVDKLFLTPEIESARFQGMYRMPNKIGCTMSLPYDDHIHNHQSVHKIVITQFETSKIPEKHIAKVSNCHHLIVTSRYQVKVWKDSGIKLPISVMTPGIDTDFFSFKDRIPDGKFKILLLGAITGRKNPIGAIRIFKIASGGSPDWRLTIKTRRTDAVKQLEQIAAEDPRIEVIVGDSHPDSVLQYYHNSDVLLWPSKGEGVGLPPLEMMATGGELVCSDHSGMADFVDDSHCYPIRTAHMESASIPGQGFSAEYIKEFGDVGDWWVPDEGHAVHQLQKCYDNWRVGKGKGVKGAQYVRKHHTLIQQSQSILNVLQKFE